MSLGSVTRMYIYYIQWHQYPVLWEHRTDGCATNSLILNLQNLVRYPTKAFPSIDSVGVPIYSLKMKISDASI